MDMQEVEKYVNIIIPNLEKKLTTEKDPSKMLELYSLYDDMLTMIAPHDFVTYNKALEFEEDKEDLTKGFYHHRQNHIGDLFQALNDMEIYDKYDTLLVSMPPRIGKSTTGIRFLSWIIGRHPNKTQLATSYSGSITGSFYAGVMEIIIGNRFNKIFTNAPLVNQNAKNQSIWLQTVKRYPSIAFISIGGSMTGVGEAGNYLYCDDLVSGIEEALSVTRLNKLWELYTTNATQRKKDGAKEIHIATRWSVHDPITKLSSANEDNPRCKILNIPCYDEDGDSNFDFEGGFSTKYYNDIASTMDKMNFNALYMCEPIEREGLLYHEDEMQYYLELPVDPPESVVAVCDSKNLGADYVSSPVGVIYGDLVYIDDVVYNNGLPEITIPLVANCWFNNKVVRGDVELNNGGNYYAENVGAEIKQLGGDTSIRMFFSGNNKTVKIITYSDFVKKHFVFRDKSTYSKNSDYARFMADLFKWTQTGKNPHDDAPDSIAMLAQMVQELHGAEVKFLNRQQLRI